MPHIIIVLIMCFFFFFIKKVLGWNMTCFHEFHPFRAFCVLEKMERCNLFSLSLSPSSYFVFICLICLKQQTVRMKKSKFLRGSFWVCTDVLPTKHQSDIIDFLFFPLPIIHHSFPPSLTWTEPYTHLILSLIHSSALTLKFHLHVSKTDIRV